MRSSRYLPSLLSLLLLCLAWSAQAQTYPSIGRGLSVDPATGRLRGPRDFFLVNADYLFEALGRTNFDSLISTTNAYLISVTTTNANLMGVTTIGTNQVLSIEDGGLLLALPGAQIVAAKIILSSDPLTADPTDATTKGYVDKQSTLFVNDLAGLQSVIPSTVQNRFAYVRGISPTDPNAGLWIWDPLSVWPELANVKKCLFLATESPGRWIKL